MSNQNKQHAFSKVITILSSIVLTATLAGCATTSHGTHNSASASSISSKVSNNSKSSVHRLDREDMDIKDQVVQYDTYKASKDKLRYLVKLNQDADLNNDSTFGLPDQTFIIKEQINKELDPNDKDSNLDSHLSVTPVNDNIPNYAFNDKGDPEHRVHGLGDTSAISRAFYTKLDGINRAGTMIAFLSKDNLGHGDRTRQVWNPAGWHNQPKLVFGKRVSPQNRGHLLAYSLSFNLDNNGAPAPGKQGSLDNPLNLATQTAYANQKSMTYFEEKVRRALASGQKVFYRVQPIYHADDLMPYAYWSQAISQDGSCSFNVLIRNVQPGLKYDYTTGRSSIDKSQTPENARPVNPLAGYEKFGKINDSYSSFNANRGNANHHVRRMIGRHIHQWVHHNF